jgi:hypothetical protein
MAAARESRSPFWLAATMASAKHSWRQMCRQPPGKQAIGQIDQSRTVLTNRASRSTTARASRGPSEAACRFQASSQWLRSPVA